MSQRLNYRTPDGIIHLWTQEEIDQHVQAMNVPVVDMVLRPGRVVTMQVEQMGRIKPPLFENEPISLQEEALLTLDMLHEQLHHRRPHTLDHETAQDLLSRIDTMTEPLKAMVQEMEMKHV